MFQDMPIPVRTVPVELNEYEITTLSQGVINHGQSITYNLNSSKTYIVTSYLIMGGVGCRQLILTIKDNEVKGVVDINGSYCSYSISNGVLTLTATHGSNNNGYAICELT